MCIIIYHVDIFVEFQQGFFAWFLESTLKSKTRGLVAVTKVGQFDVHIIA